ncbi:MAG: hypothetical protein DI547_15740 [Sphingobium sp.]|nr:MAG: hypothetical protein DI547_15740 [Sphingobium sp.]
MTIDRPTAGRTAAAHDGIIVAPLSVVPAGRPSFDAAAIVQAGAAASDAGGGAEVMVDGAGVDLPAGTAIVPAGGIARIDAGRIARAGVADGVAVAAATQRVSRTFYRMCAVYRAEGGFASRRSLNPVRPWP